MTPSRENRPRLAATLALAFLLAGAACSRPPAPAEGPGEDAAEDAVRAAADEEARGLRLSTPDATPGYVLYSPIVSDKTYVIDQAGRVVHLWASDRAPGAGAYLLENGSLLRTEREPDVEVFSGGGQGGRLREYTWDGEVVWDFLFAGDEHLLHHDVEVLPNGNVLAIVWEAKTAEEARRAGRDPDRVPDEGLWPDMVLELEPVPPGDARIVWEWHAWDHLVQDVDPELPSYGDPSENPRRIDINGDRDPQSSDEEELEQLRALGYVDDEAEPEELHSDMFHTNAVDYHPGLDQIALSSPRFDEIWIIDHSTTTEEAAGSTGGRWGHGGDLLYRWGNPRAYGRGTAAEQRLFDQHDVRWIEEGLPGEGNLMIFSNNEPGADDSAHSAVLEIAPPVHRPGVYVLPESGPFGPGEPVWSYRAPGSFHSSFISGAHRLPNGNTLITEGATGRFFEVDAEGEIVWEYRTPYSGDVRMADGSPPHPVGEEQKHGVFRATKIPPDHPALAGRTLEPLDPQPPIETAPWPAREEEASDEEGDEAPDEVPDRGATGR